MARTIVIGDLHGCYPEACELLRTLQVGSTDRVIFVGDLVDRGPEPRGCVELAMRHECVLGNHEERHLWQRNTLLGKLAPGHRATREALKPEHYEYFARLPTFIRLPEHQAAVIHAGALPGLSLEQQDKYHLLHAQCVKPPGRKSHWPSKAPEDFTFWTKHWRGPERLVFGHTVVDKPLVTEHAVGIDTGAVFGGGLTAVILPSWEIFTLPTTPQVPPRGGGVAPWPLDAGVNAYS